MKKLRIFNINNDYGIATGNIILKASVDDNTDIIEEMELPDSLVEQFNQDPSILKAEFDKKDKKIKLVDNQTKKEIR